MVLNYIASLIFFIFPLLYVLFKQIKVRFKFLDISVRHGCKVAGERFCSDKLTYDYFVSLLIRFIIIVLIQKFMFLDYSYFGKISIINYGQYNAVLLGIYFAFVTMIGRVFNSFIAIRAHNKSVSKFITKTDFFTVLIFLICVNFRMPIDLLTNAVLLVGSSAFLYFRQNKRLLQ